MTTLRALAISLLPGGLLYLAWKLATSCRHRVELAHRLPDGSMGLACAACGRERAHPWGGGRWVPCAGPESGIEREARERAIEARSAVSVMKARKQR